MNTNIEHMAIVNANDALTQKLTGELPNATAYHWQYLDDCHNTLQSLHHNPPVLWILCADDQSDEIFDFIPLVTQYSLGKILVIDTRKIHMPAMWIGYFKEGVSGCIVDPNPNNITYTVSLLLQQHGILQLPNTLQKILCHRIADHPFTPLTQQLIEMCFDAQLIVDTNCTLTEHLAVIEQQLLEQFQQDDLYALLPPLIEMLWQQNNK
jgi:hypothetical protein